MAFLGKIGKVLGLGKTSEVLGGLTGGLVSGGLSLIGGILGNKSTESSAREQMVFQDYQTSTQYQRAVKDLQAAGLNPMLAYTQGGASAASGAYAPQQDVISPAVSSALQAAAARETIQNLKETNKNIAEDTNLKKLQGEKVIYDTILAQLSQPLIAAQAQTANQVSRSSKVQADIDEQYKELLTLIQGAGGLSTAFKNALSFGNKEIIHKYIKSSPAKP